MAAFRSPLHVLLYRAFGWEDTMPAFAHLPLLLKPEGNGKLSKRDGDRLGFPISAGMARPQVRRSVFRLSRIGLSAGSCHQFPCLAGLEPGNDQELMSMDELVKLFNLSHCSKSGAKFDYKKGIWFNHEYILQKSDEGACGTFKPVLKEHGVDLGIQRCVPYYGSLPGKGPRQLREGTVGSGTFLLCCS